MSIATTVIDSLAFGGNGVCRINGKVCFVPLSCPGDQLSLKIVSEKRSYQMAAINEIIKRSADRVTPPCPLFGNCGGCNWQHIDYQKQLQAKREIHATALWRSARVEAELVRDTIPSPKQYNYRSRVQFKLDFRDNRLQIGFFQTGSHLVVDAAEGCLIARPVINQALDKLRMVFSNFKEPRNIPEISIECGDNQAVAVITYTGANYSETASFLSDNFHRLTPLDGIFLKSGRSHLPKKVCGDAKLIYSMPATLQNGSEPLKLGFKPGGFSQVNSSQNHLILSLIRQMADLNSNQQLLDLYCGNGNFSIALAADVATVTGVEGHQDSILAAVDNCRRNSVVNAYYICSDVKAAIKRFIADKKHFDLLLLDPPRAGAAEIVADVAKLAPKKIIYVSCDSSTLARDCAALKSNGYQVIESLPVDMFPQTFHVESVTLLKKIV